MDVKGERTEGSQKLSLSLPRFLFRIFKHALGNTVTSRDTT